MTSPTTVFLADSNCTLLEYPIFSKTKYLLQSFQYWDQDTLFYILLISSFPLYSSTKHRISGSAALHGQTGTFLVSRCRVVWMWSNPNNQAVQIAESLIKGTDLMNSSVWMNPLLLLKIQAAFVALGFTLQSPPPLPSHTLLSAPQWIGTDDSLKEKADFKILYLIVDFNKEYKWTWDFWRQGKSIFQIL